MKKLELVGAFVGVAITLGVFTAAGAERRVVAVRSISAPAGATATNAVKTFRIAGTAIDAEGKPVAGAVVECYQQPRVPTGPRGNDMEITQRSTTATDGAFELQVQGSPTVVMARKQGLASTWMQHWSLTKDLTNEHLYFAPPTALAGLVVDEADKPVADAAVWVAYACTVRELEEGRQSYAYMTGKPGRDYFSTRTGADGRFTIQAFPTNTSADFAVTKPGKVLRELEREHISPDTMRFQPGQKEVKLVVEPAGGIEGKVVVKDTGQPLAGMRFGLLPKRSVVFGMAEREPVESRADGTFRVADVTPGTYDLRANYGTNAFAEWVAETVPVAVESGQTTRDVQVFATRGGLLEVTVLGKVDRQPMAEAGINVYRENYHAGSASGSNGLAVLRLPPGDYRVSVYKEGSRSEANEVTVEAGGTNRLQIELSPPPKIAGTVRDPSGAPVPGLQISVMPNWGSHNEATTDDKGRYEMSWDPQRYGRQDPFCLVARDAARNLAVAQEIEESTSTLDLRLEPGLIISGKVENETGKALSNASVMIFFYNGNSGFQLPDKPLRTDAQGRFEATGMPRGRRFSLNTTAKGYGSASRNIQEDAETNRVEVETCVLKIANQKLAGAVLDADEKPVPRAHVYMYGNEQPQGSARTDEQGRFKFDAVCEGTISVSASARNAHGNVRVQAGDTNVVIHLGQSESYSSRSTPKRSSLKGKPLPDLAAVELGTDCAPAGKPVLLCLFDVDQRPSRRFVKQLAEQCEALRQKGVTVLGLQAAITSADTLKEWKDANPVSFPVGRVAEKADKTKWACDTQTLPWLILTDSERRVTAEGFALEELDAKLKSQAKP